MVFKLSEETQGFKDTLRRFFENELKSPVARQVADPSGEAAKKLLAAFTALGLNEIYSVQGQALDSLAELVLLASEMGRALCPQHFSEALVAGPLFFSSFCDQSAIACLEKTLGVERLRLLRAGNSIVLRTPLFYQDSSVLLIKLHNDYHHTLTGTLRLVPDYIELGYILYVDQQAAYLIATDQPGKIESSPESALDLTLPRSCIVLKEALAIRIEISAVASYRAVSRVLVAAELFGACQKAFEMTVSYVKTRQQFSQPIGSFQVVQHALADIYQKIEMLDSLLSFSVWSIRKSPAQSGLSSEALLRLAIRECVGIVEKTIQLHGGIGFTWEHELHFYLRRVRSLVALAGSQEVHEGGFLKVARQVAEG